MATARTYSANPDALPDVTPGAADHAVAAPRGAGVVTPPEQPRGGGETPHIRPGRSDDAARLAELGARCFTAAFGAANRPEDLAAYLAASFSADRQRAELASPDVTFLLAEPAQEQELTGYAMLRFGSREVGVAGERPVELVRLYTAPERIGSGVGARLLAASLSLAAERGCDVLWLGVWEHNPRAQAFYRRHGFVDVGSHAFQLGSDRQIDRLMVRAVGTAG